MCPLTFVHEYVLLGFSYSVDYQSYWYYSILTEFSTNEKKNIMSGKGYNSSAAAGSGNKVPQGLS